MEIKYTSISIKKRLLALTLLVIFFLCALIVRLIFLQVINAEEIKAKAYYQWLRDLPMTASRGNITDRNGVKLATSYTTYDIYIRPADIESVEEATRVIVLATGLDHEKVYEKVSKKGYSEVLVCKAQEKSVVEKILDNYTNGIFFTENTSRNYQYGNLLTQILGFVSVDGNGQSGLEAEYNKYLKGINGVSMVESDLKGTTLDDSLSYYLPSIDGLNLQLTIDIRIQKIVENVLTNAQISNASKTATAVVMNPQTGEILAISTKPSYDLNDVPRDDMETLLEMSRAIAITDAYEPGSTFKIITTAIAMSEGLTSQHDYFYCGGYRLVNGVKIKCHRRTGHGSQSLQQGLSNSCNCVFMELIRRIGLEKFYRYLESFGISTGYNLDFPGEGKGVLMPKSLVTDGDLFRMGFGQSVALTPLALINSVCACINGGKLMQPHFVTKITNNAGNVVYEKTPTILKQVIKSSVSNPLNQMLEKVVSNGGGRHAAVPGYNIGGKTGTAQKYENGKIAEGKYVASFIGYYPTDKPEYCVLVVIDEPKGAYYGGVVASPIAKSIFEGIFDVVEEPKNQNAYEEDKLSRASVEMPNLVGLTLTEAVAKITSLGLQYLTSGQGTYVKEQIASPGAMVCEGDIVLLIF